MRGARIVGEDSSLLSFTLFLLSNLSSARSLLFPKGAWKMLRATGHVRMAFSMGNTNFLFFSVLYFQFRTPHLFFSPPLLVRPALPCGIWHALAGRYTV